jgi:hypothetical protein
MTELELTISLTLLTLKESYKLKMPQNTNRQAQESSNHQGGVPLSSLQNVSSPATTPPMRLNIPGVGLLIETKKNKGSKQSAVSTIPTNQVPPKLRDAFGAGSTKE